MPTLYENVQVRCSEMGKTVAGLERELGLNRGTIRKWSEHFPSVNRVQAVAEALDTTVDALIKGGD